jgi:hypothetical protein
MAGSSANIDTAELRSTVSTHFARANEKTWAGSSL